MGLRRGESDIENIAPATARVECCTPPPGAMSIDEFADFAFDVGLPKRSNHKAALPVGICFGFEVLQRAAATHTEMLADWRNTELARRDDLHEMPPVGMAGPWLGLDRF